MELQKLFTFGGTQIRVLGTPEAPLFCAADVCGVLGIVNSRDAALGMDTDETITVGNADGNPRGGIPHQITYVTESGLYRLIFRSRKPEAEHFRRWVFREVLPAIRQHGSYQRAAAPLIHPQRQAQIDEIGQWAACLRRIGVKDAIIASRAAKLFLEPPRRLAAALKSGPSPDLTTLIDLLVDSHLYRTAAQAEGPALRLPVISARITLAEMVPVARRAGLLADLLGSVEEIAQARGISAEAAAGWYDRPMANSFAARLRPLLGHTVRGRDGHCYRLAARTGSRVSTFILTRATTTES